MIEDGHNVRVPDLGGRLGFLEKAGLKALEILHRGRDLQHLDRHRLPDARLPPLVHHRKAAGAEHAEDLVAVVQHGTGIDPRPGLRGCAHGSVWGRA